MRAITKHIPNFITCLNLFSGCIACVMAFDGNFLMAAVFIYIAAVLDFLDGLMARALKAYSEIGKQLDSLADMVSFGLAPGMIMFSLLARIFFYKGAPDFAEYIPYIAFVIPVFSALRLAKFNIDDRQTTSFIGLPTPANAIFWASLACCLPSFLLQYYGIFLILFILVFSYLLVSELPMFSLKFKNLKWGDNAIRFIFIALSALLLVFGIENLYLVIVLYIIMSLIIAPFSKKEEKDL